MNGKWAIRATFLAAAALLPLAGCEKGDVGEGDELAQVTVRASIRLDGMEPDEDCLWPSLSADGRYIAFYSASKRLTPNDSNTLQDIFLKDRLTGKIENLTMFTPVGEYPPYAPDDCRQPCLSGNARYVVFRSQGGWVPYMMPAGGTGSIYCLYRYDRVNKEYLRAFRACAVDPGPPPTLDDVPPLDNLDSPSVSADGRYVAFASEASNFTLNGTSLFDNQTRNMIYVYDMDTGTTRLVSRALSGAQIPCNQNCSSPMISADGRYVVFESTATDLDSRATVSPQIYVFLANISVNPITVETVSFNSAGVIATDDTYRPVVSGDGRYVAFQSEATGWIPELAAGYYSSPYIVRRDLRSAPPSTEVVTDMSGNQDYPVWPPGQPIAMSGDGRFIGFQSKEDILYSVPFNDMRQIFVRDMSRDMQSGRFLVSRHKDGTPSLLPCENIAFSRDGSWVAWDTQGSSLVDGDTNGGYDVFMRGPLR